MAYLAANLHRMRRMPNIEWNLAAWSSGRDWSGEGEAWSAPWGSSEAQWFGMLYPRLHRWLPARSVMEIAPGYGRWTRFLVPNCAAFVGVDLSATAIQACQQSFAAAEHARFHRNDGLTLPPGGPFDLVFSFDSLVHAELEVFEAYVPQILANLAPGGVAFLHHSNLAALDPAMDNPHHRARSVSAVKLRQLVEASGGAVLVQEVISWGAIVQHDCMTLFGRQDSFPQSQPVLLDNPETWREARMIQQFQAPWNR